MLKKFTQGQNREALNRLNKVVENTNKQFDGANLQRAPQKKDRDIIYLGKVDTAGTGTFTGTFLDSAGNKVNSSSPYYQQTIYGTAESVNDEFLAVIKNGKWYSITGGSGGGGDRMAYVKTAPTSGKTIQCYLDTYLTGDEITVYCRVWANDGNTGDFTGWFTPSVEAGDYLWVQQITVSETLRWQSKTEFYLTEIREC